MKDPNPSTFDTAVIGAGLAGLVAANRLAAASAWTAADALLGTP
tara:strand:- start:820 stop:951 length:132 start_codon:yes stop_codon:yes gene_type:complete